MTSDASEEVLSQLRLAYTNMRMRLRAARTEEDRKVIRHWLRKLEDARDAELRSRREYQK